MTLFGKPVVFWLTPCCAMRTGMPAPEPFVNLYVRVTNGCNAGCRFCCNENADKAQGFNLGKFGKVLEEIAASGIRLNRVTLTGGEPSTRPQTVKSIVGLIEKNPRFHFTQVQLHTNGLTAAAKALIALPRIDAVSLSLHHYDAAALSEIYGCAVPETLPEFPARMKSKINLSCNLIKGYIDAPAEAEKLLSYIASKGYTSVGFAGLMKLNKYAAERYVNPWAMDFDSIRTLVKTEEKSHEGACRCRNYIYTGAERPVGVYVRETIDTGYCASSLLFDGEHLRQGFSNDNIIY